MNLRDKILATLVGSVLVLGSESSSAFLGAEIVQTGAECRKDPTAGGTLVRTSLGVIENSNSLLNLWIGCPLVRVQDFYEISTVEVVLNDNHNSDEVQCRLECYDDSSSSYDVTALEETTVNGDYKTLTLSSSGLTTWENGRCLIGCSIPDTDSGTSGLVSYQVNSDTL